ACARPAAATNRCITPDGRILYTDGRCDAVGAQPHGEMKGAISVVPSPQTKPSAPRAAPAAAEEPRSLRTVFRKSAKAPTLTVCYQPKDARAGAMLEGGESAIKQAWSLWNAGCNINYEYTGQCPADVGAPAARDRPRVRPCGRGRALPQSGRRHVLGRQAGGAYRVRPGSLQPGNRAALRHQGRVPLAAFEQALGRGVSRHLDQRAVHPRAVLSLRARLLERRDDPPGAREVGCQRAVHGGDVRGIDQALHAVAQAARVARVGRGALDVAEGVGAVDRLDARRTAFDQEAAADVGELAAAAAAQGTEARRHVLACHESRDHPLARP